MFVFDRIKQVEVQSQHSQAIMGRDNPKEIGNSESFHKKEEEVVSLGILRSKENRKLV